MIVTEIIPTLREAVAEVRCKQRRIGFVPTMGALHAGHLSLIDAAIKACDFIVVSIFVNPTQFGPSEDLAEYPRPLERDLTLCQRRGVDLVFTPSPEQMYGAENLTWVTVSDLTEPLCGHSRPGHFRGVATVCTKLFNIVQPDLAFFGQKDAQQALVIRRMVADLNLPLRIVVCPTVRETDGLALSSRNRYLKPAERREAPSLYRALAICREQILAGQRDRLILEQTLQQELGKSALVEVEYAAILDENTLKPRTPLYGRVLIAVAARVGKVRLIDNIAVDVHD